MVELPFQVIIFLNPVYAWSFFIIAYAVLGGGIKYVDDAFDEKTFRVSRALLLAPLLGVFWAFCMALSSASATILAAIVLGVLLKGKIDNIAHQVGILSIFGVLFFLGLINFLWAPLIFLTLAGLIDEIGNDFVDNNQANKFITKFFEYMVAMKLAVLVFALLGSFGILYFFAFLSFDLAYAGVMFYSKDIANKRKFYYHLNSNDLPGGFSK